jgi:hypothetical protein
MTFRPPRPPKRRAVGGVEDSLPPSSSSPSSATTSRSTSRSASPSKSSTVHHHLVPPPMVPKTRRPRHSRSLYLPGPERILTLPGQEYSQMPSASRGHTARVTHFPRRDLGAPREPPEVPDDDLCRSSEPFDIINNVFISDAPDAEELQREKQRLKKQKQWQRWTQDVIPSLLRPHLQLLHNSASLCSVPQHTKHQCKCNAASLRRLKVVCVSFECEFNISRYITFY